MHSFKTILTIIIVETLQAILRTKLMIVKHRMKFQAMKICTPKAEVFYEDN